jgi:tetratricopeptide (TPR) repeat protein
VYVHVGLLDEALQESEQALAINPSNTLVRFRICEALLFGHKYDQALAALRDLPGDLNPALVGHHIVWTLFKLGKNDEASTTLAELEKSRSEDTGGLFTSIHAVLAAAAGQQQEAEELIKSALDKGKGFGHFHHTAYDIASAYALLKRPKEAMKFLEIAANDGFPCYPLYERDSNLDNLRSDPAFISLLAQLKKQWEHYKTVV